VPPLGELITEDAPFHVIEYVVALSNASVTATELKWFDHAKESEFDGAL
jgi:hypothetical protein